jgi:hypothetical protein
MLLGVVTDACIEAIVDGGAAENIGDFGSASEAQDWIIQKSTAYFRARQK